MRYPEINFDYNTTKFLFNNINNYRIDRAKEPNPIQNQFFKVATNDILSILQVRKMSLERIALERSGLKFDELDHMDDPQRLADEHGIDIQKLSTEIKFSNRNSGDKLNQILEASFVAYLSRNYEYSPANAIERDKSELIKAKDKFSEYLYQLGTKIDSVIISNVKPMVLKNIDIDLNPN